MSKVLGLGWAPPLCSSSGNFNDQQICCCSCLLVNWATSGDVSGYRNPSRQVTTRPSLAAGHALKYRTICSKTHTPSENLLQHVLQIPVRTGDFVVQWGLNQDYSQGPKDSQSPSCLPHIVPPLPMQANRCQKPTGSPQRYCGLASRHNKASST